MVYSFMYPSMVLLFMHRSMKLLIVSCMKLHEVIHVLMYEVIFSGYSFMHV